MNGIRKRRIIAQEMMRAFMMISERVAFREAMALGCRMLVVSEIVSFRRVWTFRRAILCCRISMISERLPYR